MSAETARGIVADLEDSPVERCKAWIVQRNTSSRQAYDKAGFRVYGTW